MEIPLSHVADRAGYDVAIIGGGIVGLATGLAVLKRYPHASVAILEKEQHWAAHQTGRNSGVIHSGVYYKPGSLKALLARAGSDSMLNFCDRYGIEHDRCGKVIVATKADQLSALVDLRDRGRANGLTIRELNSGQLKEIEPHCVGIAALHVPAAGIVDYKEVANKMVDQLAERGAALLNGHAVVGIAAPRLEVSGSAASTVITDKGEVRCRFVINCSGLHSDRVLAMDTANKTLEELSANIEAGASVADFKIVPFRGEYYQLKPEKSHLVKNLIYPVPNPAFPFLGVHFTRMIGGGIEAGPNAVLATKREGYSKSDLSIRDTADTLMYPGFWRLAMKYWREGTHEMMRSFSKKLFARSLQELVPEVETADLVPSPAGVRAQALRRDGTLEQDFRIVGSEHSLHICNAPSPAATASLEIGAHIARLVGEYRPDLAK